MADFPRWMHHLGERAAAPDFHRWREMVTAAGGCTHPIRLVGNSATVDTTTGEVLSTYDTADEPTGYLLTACGNRRASRCESCARVYADDTFHLIRSGLAGGRDVPDSVALHPRVFATFTAPSFGPVHRRALSRDGRALPCRPRDSGPSCLARHEPDDPLLGQAIDPGTYDYSGAVLWNHHAGELWHVFTIYLRRHLAERLAVPRSKLNDHLRTEYAKVAEYQSRGLVHFHAVIRLDGPAGPSEPPPFGIDADDLTDAVTTAAQAVSVSISTRTLRWGKQLDVRPITTDAGWTDKRVARYIAKYATKGAEAAGTVNRPLRNIRHLDRIRGLTPHARRMIEACWTEADHHPRLRDWAHMLGYGGHFSTKSRRYSTTLTTIRKDRADHRATQARSASGLPPLPDHTARFGTWHVLGTGYKTTAEETWAEHIREQKRRAG
ncbi:replication initiator [Actinokineospora sp. 24-640]